MHWDMGRLQVSQSPRPYMHPRILSVFGKMIIVNARLR